MTRSAKNWCITVNNPDSYCLQFREEVMQYMICGKEVGESGTPHIQGYVQFKNRETLNSVKQFFPRCHAEVARGSPAQNVAYCGKDGDSHAHGELKVPGQRSDLKLVKDAIVAGASYSDIIELDFGLALRYQKSIGNLIEYNRCNRSWPTELYIYWGATGTGKSRKAFEEYPEGYWKSRGDWWDGYEGQEVVIIDDFYGWLPFDEMLRLTDRYPMQVQVKGGFRKFVAKKIIITSNKAYRDWYPNISSEELWNAFERRIVSCCEFKRLGNGS